MTLRTRSLLLLAVLLTMSAAVTTLWPRPAPVVPPPLVGRDAAGTVTLDVRPSQSLVRAEGAELFAQVTVRVASEQTGDVPVSLAVLLDRSGSMRGEKLARAKAAARALLARLRPGDELTVVHFGSDVTASTTYRAGVDPGDAVAAFIDETEASGSTNLSAGLEAAGRALIEARGLPRIVLISDGQPTAGLTGEAALEGLAETIHRQGIAVTALGVGLDFNSTLLQRLADRGGGLYGFLESAEHLDEVLALELGQARAAHAQQVSLVLTPAPGVTIVDVPGRLVSPRGPGLVMPLADLKQTDEARVFVSLRTSPSAAASLALLEARLELSAATGPRRGQRESLLASAGVGVTDDAGLETGSRVEPVFSDCVRAMGARKLIEAAGAFDRGDRALAFSLLDNARSVFGLSADALAGEEADLRAVRGRWERTQDPTDRRREALGLERHKLTSFSKETYGY